MARTQPKGYRKWGKHTISLGAAPQHTGEKHSYGPFTVLDRTNISDHSFLKVGAIAVIGEGWDPDGASTATSLFGVTTNRSFVWGVIVKENAPAGKYLYRIIYFEKEDNGTLHPRSASSAPLTLSDGSYGTIAAFTAGAFPKTEIVNNAATDTQFNNAFVGIDVDSVDDNNDGRPGGDGISLGDLFIGRIGFRWDAYQFANSGTGDDAVYRFTRHYSAPGNGEAPVYYRVRNLGADKDYGGTGKNADALSVELEHGASGQLIVPGSTLAATESAQTGTLFQHDHNNEGALYIEETSYGDNGDVHRVFSDNIRSGVAAGGGDALISFRLWQTPTSADPEQYPYEDKKVLFTSKGHASHAIWVG